MAFSAYCMPCLHPANSLFRSSPERTHLLPPGIIGIRSVFSFLFVRFRLDGPSSPCYAHARGRTNCREPPPREPAPMRLTVQPIRLKLRFVALSVVIGFTACAGPQQASSSRGVGTPGVSAYVPPDQATTSQALLDRCQQAAQPVDNKGLSAACDQLRRQAHNQPGNTASK